MPPERHVRGTLEPHVRDQGGKIKQAWFAAFGAITFPLAIAAERLGGPEFESVIGVCALIVFVGAALFAAVVFRHGTGESRP